MTQRKDAKALRSQRLPDPWPLFPAMLRVLCVLCVSLPALAAAQVTRPVDAVHAVAVDVAALQAQGLDVSGVRYVWNPGGSVEDVALVSFVANSVLSRSARNFAPDVAGSPVQTLADRELIRLDLAGLCDDAAELPELLALWDRIRNPYFLIANAGQQKQTVEPYQASDGKTYDYKLVSVPAQFGPHVDLEEAAALQLALAAGNPIVWTQSLYQSALTQADGGLYYEFTQVRRSRSESESDRDAWLRGLGVSSELISTLRADQRAGLITSKVTGKVRVITLFSVPSRLGVNQGLVSITDDPLDERVSDPARDPFLNLLDFQADGQEVMAERPNGHLLYLLFDAAGNLVDEAPPNLVADHEIPRPYTRRLQPAISCIRCHGQAAEDGWKPFANEVREIFASGLGVLEDGTLAEVARLYAGKLDKPLDRAREDHSDAIVECVGSAVNADGLPWQFADVSAALTQRFNEHLYQPVDAARACRELGYDAGEDAVASLQALLGLPTSGVEDIRLGLLLLGRSINRAQWELVYLDAASRAAVTQSAEED